MFFSNLETKTLLTFAFVIFYKDIVRIALNYYYPNALFGYIDDSVNGVGIW